MHYRGLAVVSCGTEFLLIYDFTRGLVAHFCIRINLLVIAHHFLAVLDNTIYDFSYSGLVLFPLFPQPFQKFLPLGIQRIVPLDPEDWLPFLVFVAIIVKLFEGLLIEV